MDTLYLFDHVFASILEIISLYAEINALLSVEFNLLKLFNFARGFFHFNENLTTKFADVSHFSGRYPHSALRYSGGEALKIAKNYDFHVILKLFTRFVILIRDYPYLQDCSTYLRGLITLFIT